MLTVRRDGTRRLYRTRPEGLAEGAQVPESFWDEQLAALKQEIESSRDRNGQDDRSPLPTRSRARSTSPRHHRRSTPTFDPVKALRWKGQDATLDPRPGGVYRLILGEGNIVRGEYVRLTPYSQIVFTWGWEGESAPIPPGASTVEINLVAEQDGTLVRLRHYGLPPSARQAHVEGWDYFLPRLSAPSRRIPRPALTSREMSEIKAARWLHLCRPTR